MPEAALRIGEVARRAGVPVSTVKHYLREGLLPAPVKTARNSAWYPEEAVARVRLVKEVQAGALLPLAALRAALARGADPDEVRRYFRVRTALAPVPQAADAAAYLGPDRFRPAELERLARMGLLPRGADGAVRLGPLDAALLDALLRLRRLGLTPERGFRVDDLAVYLRPLEALARAEVRLALRGLLGRMPPERVARVADEIIDGATELVALLHRKLVARVIAQGARPAARPRRTRRA